MRWLTYISSLFILIYIFGCETEFDPISPADTIPVVFCLLDNSDTAHWVKLSRTFLLDEALKPDNLPFDSLGFPEARVFLEKWNGDYLYARAELNPDEIPRDPGIFPKTPNPQYYLKKEESTLIFFSDPNPQDLVKLIIDIPDMPVVYSEAVPLASINVRIPRKDGDNPYLYGEKPYEITWSAAGYYHELFLEFCYEDHYDDSVAYRSVTWKEFHSIPGYDNLPYTEPVLGQHLMIRIAANIKPDKQVRYRTFDRIKIHFYATDKYLYTHKLTEQIKSIDQTGIQFNNIVNGLGLFGARSKAERWFVLGFVELDSLTKGQFTKDLGFVD